MKTPPTHEAATAGLPSSTTLRVLTWNVGELYWPWRGNQLKDRDVDAVREVLDEIDADVVLLQELLHEGQLQRLAKDRYLGALSTVCGYDRHVAALVRTEFAPRFFHHLLEPTRRGMVEAQFNFAGHAMRAFSLHFDVFHPERRFQQIRAATAQMRTDAALTIAGGDFNYDPYVSKRLCRTVDLAAEALMQDALSELAADAGPTLVGFLRVDRMFAGGDAMRGCRAQVSTRRLPLGDHAPLICDLAITSR